MYRHLINDKDSLIMHKYVQILSYEDKFIIVLQFMGSNATLHLGKDAESSLVTPLTHEF